MSECYSLLPGHSTQLEKDLEKLQCRVYDQPMLHRDLWNPETCPSELLPWLAWAESVDVWNDRWPDSTKRAVIANSRTLHEIKGTQKAVEDSLAALGVRVEVVEWWQEAPPAERGTQKLTLWVNHNINPDADIMIDSEVVRDLVSSVNRAKRGCIHYMLTLGVEFDAPGIGYAMSSEAEAGINAEIHHDDHAVHYGAGLALAGTSELEVRLDAGIQQDESAVHYRSGVAFAGTGEMAARLDAGIQITEHAVFHEGTFLFTGSVEAAASINMDMHL